MRLLLVLKMVLKVAIVIKLLSTMCLAQALNYPVGNPTGTAGTGNARTDPDNFFIRNNLAGLTEIPVDEEEDNSNKLTSHSKSGWRLWVEQQFLVYKFKNRTFALTEDLTYIPVSTQGTVVNPNLAGEITYTSKNHRYGFGFGAYQLEDYQSRFRLDDDKLPANAKSSALLYDTRISSTDFIIGSALRLHKTFSIGAGFVFGRAAIALKQPDLFFGSYSDFSPSGGEKRANLNGFDAPGLSVGFHFRPTSFISLGATFRNRRNYDIKGEVHNIRALGFENGDLVSFFIPSIKAKGKYSLPVIGEAGIEVRLGQKLKLNGDFRYYNYSSTQEVYIMVQAKSPNIAVNSLGSYGDFADAKAMHFGAIYKLNNQTRINLGLEYNFNTLEDYGLNHQVIDTGQAITGGIVKKIKGQWYSLSTAVIIGRNRSKPYFTFNPYSIKTENFNGNGFVFSLGLRLNKLT